ncbi:hypothetical protein FT663_00264 [Candidozyma haemuli var. vulneris]|uniref:Uncharacterized protein n=1 Tax=Candidozyma haemuli TaxID=45357 RepID=A0A2V1APA0_9ASCO|nr:hypothetical protein CXQ85_003553 [[Candida] haemuloni]KAF3993594.1 hypothetical protein FT662_00514 [[Candida] haemuloni var. vulneris]KAF3995668.1 hypothetical protein FT663_00264 [[Candida] haemuloni var. vulneris]PVH19699.1 hypothetical protein CXQ85_003553 [[Candida] haemuloni]
MLSRVARLGLTRNLAPRSAVALRGSLLRPTAIQSGKPQAVFTRYASSSNENDLPDDDILKVQDVVSKVQQHPHIRELLNEFQDIIVKKGFNPNEQPSITQVMRLFADKEVRQLISKLKDAFEEAGIKISPDDMGSFMKMFKK